MPEIAPDIESELELGPGPEPLLKSSKPVGCAMTEAGVAVTPFPYIVTFPVRAASSTGHVMVWVFSTHTPQVTTVLMKFGGMFGRIQVSEAPV